MKNSTINWDSTSKAYVAPRSTERHLFVFKLKIETMFDTYYLYRCHDTSVWKITAKYSQDIEWYFRKHNSIKKIDRAIADYEASQFFCS